MDKVLGFFSCSHCITRVPVRLIVIRLHMGKGRADDDVIVALS